MRAMDYLHHSSRENLRLRIQIHIGAARSEALGAGRDFGRAQEPDGLDSVRGGSLELIDEGNADVRRA